jgi:hypothetical protein
MNLYNFFLLILSFICTLSEALPAGSSQCVPVNEDGAALRMTNGAGISLFSNQVRINIVDSHIEPSSFYPWGGFTVSIHNDYCLPLRIFFNLPNGQREERVISARTTSPRAFVHRGVIQGAIVRVAIQDYF